MCRSVVLLELEEFRSLVYLGKLQDILDVRPAEGIDALCIIAYHAHLLVLLRELEHDAMLGKVRILILVHQHIAELHGILLADVRKVAEQDIGIDQQVIEVHGIALTATLPILAVNLVRSRHLGIPVGLDYFGIRSIRIRRHQMVLGIADTALDAARLVGLVVELHFLDNALDQALGVRSIVNGKVGREADGLRLGAENTREDGMESTHPQIACPLSYLTADTLLHLSGGLVRKGQRQDVPRVIPLVHEMGNLVGKYTSLSRACTGYHQRRPFIVKDSRPLAFIQFIQITVHHIVFSFKATKIGKIKREANILKPNNVI